MAEEFLISGGIPRYFGELMEGHAFKKAELAKINFTNNTYESKFSYTTPREYRSDILPSLGFTGISVYGNKIYAPTRTEVLVLNMHDYSVIDIIRDPLFNDIHSVHVLGDILYVVVTGLDALFSYNLNTGERAIANVLGKNPFHRYSENDNLNKVHSLKPHEAHPNHVFTINNEIWVTRLKQQDAVCISDLNKRIIIEEGLPHDGYVKDNLVYFTTVNGYVIVYDINSLKKVNVIKLTGPESNNKTPLGWCRGICVNDDNFYVGFTLLRTTKITENIGWVKTMIDVNEICKKPAPTRIEKYSLKGECLDCYYLPKDSIQSIFSIHKLN